MMEKETLYHQKQMVISFFSLSASESTHERIKKETFTRKKNKNVLGESDVSTAAA